MNKKLIDLAFYIYLKGVVGVTAPVFYRIDCFSCNSKQLSHLLKHPLAKHKRVRAISMTLDSVERRNPIRKFNLTVAYSETQGAEGG